MSGGESRLIEKIVGYIRDQIVYENDDRLEDVLEELVEVECALDTYGCGKFIDEIKYQIKTICDKNNKCPDCFSDIDLEYDKETHNHLDDSPVEYWAVRICERCGWDNRME